jgi:hypothetical protein
VLAVVGVAAVAAVASYEHAYALVQAQGEAGWTGHRMACPAKRKPSTPSGRRRPRCSPIIWQ